jgi:hypothetical protein
MAQLVMVFSVVVLSGLMLIPNENSQGGCPVEYLQTLLKSI